MTARFINSAPVEREFQTRKQWQERSYFVVMKNGAPIAVLTTAFAAEQYADVVGGHVVPTPLVRSPAILTPDLIKRMVRYEPDTGRLFWLPRDRKFFDSEASYRIFHERFAGREAFTSKSTWGYLVAHPLRVTLAAHQAAWAIIYGEWPKGLIDHINGDRTDNRIANLRDVTIAENNRNRKRSKANKSGRVGVFFKTSRRRWLATIGNKEIGSFLTFEEACEARAKAEPEHGFHPNHGRSA
jgi:hypothetical protein